MVTLIFIEKNCSKEALSYVRRLKKLGVNIKFEKEGINTQALGDEMLLNTFAAIAQEESKSISQNQRHSIVKRMELGEYVDSNAPYGFRLVNKKLEVYEPEAEIVRWIFDSYLSGMSTQEIATELTNRGVPTKNGKEKWKSTKVSYMLSNERYIGDSHYQKTYRDTTVPFKQYKNRGEEDMFYATGTHKPIISKNVFESVQELLKKRQGQFSKTTKQNIYPLTSRIQCSECGSFYRRKVKPGGIKWVCAVHERDAHKCNSYYYSEERIYDGFISMINKLRFCREDILGQVISKLDTAALLYKRNNKSAYQMSEKMAEINSKILKLNQLRSKGYLEMEIHASQVAELQIQLKELKEKRLSKFESKILEMLQEVQKLKQIIFEIEEPLEDFDEHLFKEIVGIYFEEQNIDTLKSDSELYLVIYAGFAQSESESMSKNITWTVRKKFEEGKPSYAYKKLLGYKKGSDGNPEIVPKEAAIVVRIFDMYLAGDTLDEIAKKIRDENHTFENKKFSFCKQMITASLSLS